MYANERHESHAESDVIFSQNSVFMISDENTVHRNSGGAPIIDFLCTSDSSWCNRSRFNLALVQWIVTDNDASLAGGVLTSGEPEVSLAELAGDTWATCLNNRLTGACEDYDIELPEGVAGVETWFARNIGKYHVRITGVEPGAPKECPLAEDKHFNVRVFVQRDGDPGRYDYVANFHIGYYNHPSTGDSCLCIGESVSNTKWENCDDDIDRLANDAWSLYMVNYIPPSIVSYIWSLVILIDLLVPDPLPWPVPF